MKICICFGFSISSLLDLEFTHKKVASSSSPSCLIIFLQDFVGSLAIIRKCACIHVFGFLWSYNCLGMVSTLSLLRVEIYRNLT